MATRRGGETISVRQYDWHKRYHHRLLAHPGFQGLSFERRGVYDYLYDLAAIANDDGAIRIGAGERFSRRKLTEFLALLQAGRSGDPGQFMAWAKQTVDALVTAELLRVDSSSRVWLVNYADEQASISPAGLRKRAQRAREAGDDANGSGVGGPGVGVPPPQPVPSSPLTQSAGSFAGETFDASSDGDGELGQSRDCHDQRSEFRNQRRGANAPQNSESDRRREAGADGRPRFDAAAMSGEEGTGCGGGGVGDDLYSLPVVDAGCRVIRSHGQWTANMVRKAVREIGEENVWTAIGEIRQAWADGVVKGKDKATGKPSGGPLFSHIVERFKARQGVAQMAGGSNRGPIGFGG